MLLNLSCTKAAAKKKILQEVVIHENILKP